MPSANSDLRRALLVLTIVGLLALCFLPREQLARFGSFIANHTGSPSVASTDKSTELVRQGFTAESHHSTRAAEQAFQSAEAANPSNAASFAALADLYANQGRYELADTNYRAALTVVPTSASLHYRLGILELKEHLYAAAINDLRFAARANPTDLKASQALQIALNDFNTTAKTPTTIVGASPQSSRNLIINGSFEDGVPTGSWKPLNTSSSDITGWTVVSGRVDYIGTYWQASAGVRSIDLDGTPGPGALAQSFATTAGSKYRVSFDLAGNPEGPPRLKLLAVVVAGQTHTFTFDISGHSKTSMGWTTQTFSFQANAPQSTLEFKSLDEAGNWNGPVIDNVIVQPE